MKKYFSAKNIALSVLVLFLLIQLARIDKTNPTVDPAKDLITLMKPNNEIRAILKASCYDCHSNESKYPWYTNIAPFSWLVKNHINEGRQHLNFSEWGTYNIEKSDHKLEECIEEVEEGEMPLSSYTLMHKEAELSKEQKEALMHWFISIRN